MFADTPEAFGGTVYAAHYDAGPGPDTEPGPDPLPGLDAGPGIDAGPCPDADFDGLCDDEDPCPADPGPDSDSDGDGICNAADACPAHSPNDGNGNGILDCEEITASHYTTTSTCTTGITGSPFSIVNVWRCQCSEIETPFIGESCADGDSDETCHSKMCQIYDSSRPIATNACGGTTWGFHSISPLPPFYGCFDDEVAACEAHCAAGCRSGCQ